MTQASSQDFYSQISDRGPVRLTENAHFMHLFRECISFREELQTIKPYRSKIMKPHAPSAPGWYGNEVAAFEHFAQFWPWQQQQQQQAQFNTAGGPFGYRGLQPSQPLLPPPLQQFIGWPQWTNRPITSGNSHWGATSSQPLQLTTHATSAAMIQPTVTPQDEVHDSRLSSAEAALAPPGFVLGNGSASASASSASASSTTAAASASTLHASTATTTVAGGGLRLTSKLEEAVQEALLRIFRKPFVKARPSWLVNPLTKKPLEFDLFSESLRVAVEVDEAHHFVAVNKRHTSEMDFEYQRYRDAIKDILAREHGVTLIRVPFTLVKKNVEDFLREKLRQARVPIPPVSPAAL